MNENPYQVPAAELTSPVEQDSSQLNEPRGVGAGQGAAWFSEGWRLFLKVPVMLTVVSLTMMILFGVVSALPLIGIVALLFWPHLSAGVYLAFRHARHNEPVAFGDLFEPFRNMGNLLVLGALYLAVSIGLGIVAIVLVFGAVGAGALGGGAVGDPEAIGLGMIVAGLLIIAASIPMMMAFWFAPLLVHQHGLPAIEAIKKSFQACLRNIVPFLLWGVVWLVVVILLVVVAFIPILGILLALFAGLIFFPLLFSNIYVSYEDIFLR